MRFWDSMCDALCVCAAHASRRFPTLVLHTWQALRTHCAGEQAFAPYYTP
jgi:hypothetical protein